MRVGLGRRHSIVGGEIGGVGLELRVCGGYGDGVGDWGSVAVVLRSIREGDRVKSTRSVMWCVGATQDLSGSLMSLPWAHNFCDVKSPFESTDCTRNHKAIHECPTMSHCAYNANALGDLHPTTIIDSSCLSHHRSSCRHSCGGW